MSRTIMLIHGAWLTPACWDLFRAHYEAQGYNIVAPAWPLENVPIEELRKNPHPGLRKMTVKEIVDYYARMIKSLPEAPILIGHSYGGLFVQLLLDRGLGAAGVALDPVPIAGVLPPPRVLLSAWPVFSVLFGWNKVLNQSFKTFSTTFAQTLPEADNGRFIGSSLNTCSLTHTVRLATYKLFKGKTDDTKNGLWSTRAWRHQGPRQRLWVRRAERIAQVAH